MGSLSMPARLPTLAPPPQPLPHSRAGTVQAYGAGSTVAARAPHHAQQAQQQQAPRAYQETLPAAAVNHLRDPGASPAASGAGAALGPGSAAAAAGGSDQAASGTFVVREAPGAGRLPAGYGTVQSSAAVGREQEGEARIGGVGVGEEGGDASAARRGAPKAVQSARSNQQAWTVGRALLALGGSVGCTQEAIQ